MGLTRRELLIAAGATGATGLAFLLGRGSDPTPSSQSSTVELLQAKIESISDSDKKIITEISIKLAQAIADGNYTLALTFVDQTIPGIEDKLRAYQCPSGTKVDRFGEKIELAERINAVGSYVIWDSDKCKISGVTETNFVGLVFRNPNGKWQIQDFYK